MPKPKKKDSDVIGLIVRDLFSTIGWTIVYYVGAWTALLGVGAIAYHIKERRKNAKK